MTKRLDAIRQRQQIEFHSSRCAYCRDFHKGDQCIAQEDAAYLLSLVEKQRTAIIDLMDVYGLHSIEPTGCYTPVNTGELEQAIERAQQAIKCEEAEHG